MKKISSTKVVKNHSTMQATVYIRCEAERFVKKAACQAAALECVGWRTTLRRSPMYIVTGKYNAREFLGNRPVTYTFNLCDVDFMVTGRGYNGVYLRVIATHGPQQELFVSFDDDVLQTLFEVIKAEYQARIAIHGVTANEFAWL